MHHAAGTPPVRRRPDRFALPATALALLTGTGACLLLPRLPAWPLLAIGLVIGVALWWRGERIALLGVLLGGFAFAGLQVAYVLAHQLPPALEQHEATVRGRVLELPQPDPRGTRFLFRVDDDAWNPLALRGRRLQLGWYDARTHDHPRADAATPRDRLHAGSRWELTLRLRAPRGLRNPGGFDGEKQALFDRIAATGYVVDPQSARELAPAAGIDAWRERMAARIDSGVHARSSRFVRALALGDTRGLDDPDWETLRAAGLTHLIAISGFHVGLVAGFFALAASLLWRAWPALARRVPRVQAAGVGCVLGGLGYAAVAGFALPTMRTVLMIAVVVGARLARRAQRTVDALALAALTLLLADPLSVLSAGFWLSFAGVAWLLWCLPRAQAAGAWGRTREFLAAQAVATIGLLPFGVVLFGQASLAGPAANLLAIPWWSLVVVPLALVGTALEALHPGLGAWCWRLAAWSFDLAWPLFEWLAHSPLALWWLPEGRWFALPLAVLGGVWLLLPRGVPGKPLALLLWLPLLWPDRQLPATGEAELVMLDVGQGLSVLVRTTHHSLLYDMGPAVPDGFDAGERVGVPALHALGVHALDVAIVSHGDNDHAGGFPAVARAFPPGRAYTPDGAPLLPGGQACVAGTTWTWDGVRFRFLHPPRDFPYLDNESGCVLRIEAGGHAALLMADVGQIVERRLLHDAPSDVRADVVVVGHHGSRNSSDPAFVAATGAHEAMISAGFGNRFHHPNPSVVDRWRAAGAHVRVTFEDGADTVRLAATGVTVSARRDALPRLWDAARRHAETAGLSYRPE
jgi:competence protein ComEC